jgi:putative Holliday junction resolvase
VTKRILGLDHGSRRIGVAIGDLETGMAFEREPIRRHALEADLDRIGALCLEEDVGQIVIGLPLHSDGGEGEQAAAARAFGDRLAARGLEVAYADERLSSWEAGERLAEAGRIPRRASGELDSVAARLILQEYLDARRAPHARDRTVRPEENHAE